MTEPPFDELYRPATDHVLATLIRVLGDFDLEGALQEAMMVALQTWTVSDVLIRQGQLLAQVAPSPGPWPSR